MQSSGESALHDDREIKENLIVNVIKGLNVRGGRQNRAAAVDGGRVEFYCGEWLAELPHDFECRAP